MRALAARATTEGRVYFTGGVTALLMNWRTTTIDIDIKMVPEQDALFRALPKLKELLEVNVEMASPDQFIPAVPMWEDRSPLISREGLLSFHHYDFYSQALSKIERGHLRDINDVNAMLELGLIDRPRILDYFGQIEPLLYRYPAIDPETFRLAVEKIAVPLE
jgi:hypothetical protein